jgi:hypothetical protein
VILFGDSLRSGALPNIPTDLASQVGPLVDAATAAGRPLVLVTDGLLDDPERVARLPRGSQVRVVIVTLDDHLAGSVARAQASLRKELPGLRLELHSAAHWGEDEAALADVEKAVGDVDGDALLALGGKAVDQEGHIRRTVDLRQARHLVRGDGTGVVKQAADQGRFAVVDRAAGDQADDVLRPGVMQRRHQK